MQCMYVYLAAANLVAQVCPRAPTCAAPGGAVWLAAGPRTTQSARGPKVQLTQVRLKDSLSGDSYVIKALDWLKQMKDPALDHTLPLRKAHWTAPLSFSGVMRTKTWQRLTCSERGGQWITGLA